MSICKAQLRKNP